MEGQGSGGAHAVLRCSLSLKPSGSVRQETLLPQVCLQGQDQYQCEQSSGVSCPSRLGTQSIMFGSCHPAPAGLGCSGAAHPFRVRAVSWGRSERTMRSMRAGLADSLSSAALMGGGEGRAHPYPSAPSTRCLDPPQTSSCGQAVDLAEDNLLKTVCSADREARPITLAWSGVFQGNRLSGDA